MLLRVHHAHAGSGVELCTAALLTGSSLACPGRARLTQHSHWMYKTAGAVLEKALDICKNHARIVACGMVRYDVICAGLQQQHFQVCFPSRAGCKKCPQRTLHYGTRQPDGKCCRVSGPRWCCSAQEALDAVCSAGMLQEHHSHVPQLLQTTAG